MTIRAQEVAGWLLAALTLAVWCSTYALFFLRDPHARRRLHLFAWRLGNRLRPGRGRPRPVPARLLAPAVPVRTPPRTTRATPGGTTNRQAAARAVAVADPARIAEWRVDNLPLRYRLLGRVRRGANDN